MKARDIIATVLIIFAVLMALLIAFIYKLFSPEFVTHTQFSAALMGVYGSIFAGFLAVWLKITGKLTEFAQQLGRIEGYLNGRRNSGK